MASAPDFTALAHALATSGPVPTLAEAQGLYCGLLCADAMTATPRWLAELAPAGSNTAQTAVAELTRLADYTRAQLAGPVEDFTPLLPQADLITRAAALVDWLHGFLYGLALGGFTPARQSARAQEILDDFIALTQLDAAGVGTGTDEASTLEELVAFVGVATIALLAETLSIAER